MPKKTLDETTLDILRSHATVEGTAIRLTTQIDDRPSYEKMAKALKGCGFTWNRKSGTFLSDGMGDAADMLSRLQEGSTVNLKQELQFYPTPDDLASRLVDYALAVVKSDLLVGLEPSAGRGAIAKHLLPRVDVMVLTEQHEPFVEELRELFKDDGPNTLIKCCDFLQESYPGNDSINVIVMNSPFQGGRDVKHVLHAYSILAPGGALVAVVPASWSFRDTKGYEKLKEIGYEVMEECGPETFKDAAAATLVIRMRK